MNSKQKKDALNRAKKLSDKFNEQESKEFANKHKNKKWYSDFILLYNMITDKDFNVSKKTYLLIAGTLAYVVMPIDVIPDILIGVGFIDDAFVLGFLIQNIKDEIDEYKEFCKDKNKRI